MYYIIHFMNLTFGSKIDILYKNQIKKLKKSTKIGMA